MEKAQWPIFQPVIRVTIGDYVNVPQDRSPEATRNDDSDLEAVPDQLKKLGRLRPPVLERKDGLRPWRAIGEP